MKISRAAILVAALTLAGCAAPGESGGDEPKVNMQEAAEQADAILDGTFSAIKPPVNWTHGETSEGDCDVSRRRAVMTVISEERRGNFLGVVERHWKTEGYTQLGVNSSLKSPATYFETPDGFRARLRFGSDGQAFFEVATPCVDKSAVEAPTTETVGPNYAGAPIPTPDVRSDFWSAGPSDSPKP